MKTFDEQKKTELQDPDLELGRLVEDKLFIAHHEATEEVQEQSHLEVVAEYPNGGKDVQTVIDVPYAPAQDAYDEYEDFYVYIPYTSAELEQRREARYRAAIVAKIRERYSLDDELAINRQRDSKPDEWSEYNTYCEQCKAAVKEEL